VTDTRSTSCVQLVARFALWPTWYEASQQFPFAKSLQRGARMKKFLPFGAILFAASIFSLMGAEPVVAQGPAGSGASGAAQDSSHSLNPINWLKKDSNNSASASADRSDAEKKLTPVLRSQGVLAVDANASDACTSFSNLEGCLAVLHASHNLGLDFPCLRADVTGVHAGGDMSGCKVAGEKPHALHKAIHDLKPDANAKQAAKDAEQQAKSDLSAIPR
jgi:hypothetical protein